MSAWTRRLSLAVLAAALVLALALLDASPVAAQPAPEGVVRGQVTMASAGAALDGAVEVELIALEGSQIAGSVKAPVSGGVYEARVPATAARTYIPRLRYQRVDYFGDPVQFTDGAREVTRNFTVYAATEDANSLRLLQTIVTVVALDRERGELGILREDVVQVTGDRVYTGGASGITLRLPAPEGTVDASEENDAGTLANGVLAVKTPVRPGEPSSIITSYLVKYDPAVDRYRLRVTVPVPSASVVARVPREFVRAVRPVAPSEQADDQVVQDEARTVLYVVRTPGRTEAGQSLVVDIDGVAGTLYQHPLTEQPGASIAALAVLGVAGVAGLFVWRRREAVA